MKSSLEKGYFIALENMDELALLDQLMLKMKYVHILSFYPFLYIEHLTSLLHLFWLSQLTPPYTLNTWQIC